MAVAQAAGYVLPLYCIGDSHAEMLNGMLLRDVNSNEPIAVGSSMYALPTGAAEFSDEHGTVPGTLIPLLYAVRLLRFATPSPDEPGFVYAGHTIGVHAHARKRWVMIFAGELDARAIISSIPLDAVVAVRDFDLSQFPTFLTQRVVVHEALEHALSWRLERLIFLVQALRSLGIRRVALTSIPPPTLDDASYLRLTGIESHASTRYAVHWLFNRVLSAQCASANVPFVDTWADETNDDVMRPEFLHDHIHLGRGAAEIKLRAYYDLVVADGSAEVPDVPSVS